MTAAEPENYAGELVMLRGLVTVIRTIAKHSDIDELRRVLAEHEIDEQAAYSTLGEKSSREAIATPDLTGDPLTVRWDRTVIHPEVDPTEETIVCCLADDGHPVALLLDDEHREALGLLLVDPDADRDSTPELTGRLAQLLDAVRTQGGEWTTRRGQAIYRALGDRAPLRMAVRKDLHALHAMGHLVQHEQRGRRFYTLNTRNGGA